MAELGAAGRLLVSGEIEDVLPLEDEEPLNAANPVAADGQVRFDSPRVQARHEAIVKNVLKKGSFGLVILGGDHDLSENVRRLGGGKCEYVRVTMKCFREAASVVLQSCGIENWRVRVAGSEFSMAPLLRHTSGPSKTLTLPP